VSVDQSPPQTVPDLPPQVMARFRLVSLERLERIDAAWQALIAGSGSEADGETLTRELHTLKGDARVLGLGDVGMLSQRVEDLVFAALRRRFQVHEDVDIVMTMAIQFLGMLIRRKAGMVSGGIDLEGFLKQVDAVTLEWLQQPSSIPAPNTGGSARRVRTVEPVSATPDTRDRLASLTTDVYLEHLRATGATRDRLHATFAGLARAVEELGEVALGPVVEQHLAAAKALARELGKEEETRADTGGTRVKERVLEVLGVALVHLLRNAVDHGIEAPARRAGKGPGTLRVAVRERGSEVELRVEDDGRGVDIAGARAQAEAIGLVPLGATLTEEAIVDLLFRDGFSTREVPTDVSGRGVGLSAVRAEVEKVGGSIEVSTRPGRGSRFIVRVPLASHRCDVHVFTAARAPIRLAVGAEWEIAPSVGGGARCLTEWLDLPARNPVKTPVALELLLAGDRLLVAAADTPTRASAVRWCPTASSCACEVVRVGDEEALLVRPASLHERAGLR